MMLVQWDKKRLTKQTKLLDEGLAEVGKTREELGAHISYLTGESDVAKKLGQALQQMWERRIRYRSTYRSCIFRNPS